METIDVVSNWVNITLTDSDNLLNSDYLAFRFETRNPEDIFNFTFLLLNEKTELIKFVDGEKKSPLLSFRIDILK